MVDFDGKMKYSCDPDTIDLDMLGDGECESFQEASLEMVKGKQFFWFEVSVRDGVESLALEFADGRRFNLQEV